MPLLSLGSWVGYPMLGVQITLKKKNLKKEKVYKESMVERRFPPPNRALCGDNQ